MPRRTPFRFALPCLRHAARAAALLLTAAGAAAAQGLPAPLTFSGAGGAIWDNRTNSFSFTVNAPDVLPADVAVTVRLRGLVDAGAGDLFADLIFDPGAPGGPTRSVRLFDFAPGGFTGARSFDGTYAFGSSFATPLPGGAVKPGDYAAVGDLTALFGGQSVAGTYTLAVVDWWSNGGATFEGIDVVFDARVSSVPEPATVALVGGGLLGLGALARRRRGAA